MTDEQAAEKEYPYKKEDSDKWEHILFNGAQEGRRKFFIKGRQSLRSELEQEKIRSSNFAYEADRAKRDRDIAENNYEQAKQKIAELEKQLEKDVKRCPNCFSNDIIMFTADLDLCQRCGRQF